MSSERGNFLLTKSLVDHGISVDYGIERPELAFAEAPDCQYHERGHDQNRTEKFHHSPHALSRELSLSFFTLRRDILSDALCKN
jgi:hypothetical protein